MFDDALGKKVTLLTVLAAKPKSRRRLGHNILRHYKEVFVLTQINGYILKIIKWLDVCLYVNVHTLKVYMVVVIVLLVCLVIIAILLAYFSTVDVYAGKESGIESVNIMMKALVMYMKMRLW